VFPKQRTHTIGVAGIHANNPDLKARLADYLALKKLDIANHRVKGQYIPFGDYRARPGRGNTLLAGDAAGFADPITGEGIGFAMQSGAAAARAILAPGAAPGSALAERYFTEIADLTRSLRAARRWRWLIYPAPAHGLFASAFGRAGVLRSGYLDILAGRREYDALPALFAAQAGRALEHLAPRRAISPRS
jgi:flavin-dependent dehydrogenase